MTGLRLAAMAPARMSDAAARALITEYTGQSPFTVVASEECDLKHSRIDMGILTTKDTLEAAGRDALSLRRAMEALNALACCRGFGVDENPAFWRGATSADAASGHFCGPRFALADRIFSRYHMEVYMKTSYEAMAWAVVTCFSKDPVSEAMSERREIHCRLGQFLEREPPMVDIQMDFPDGFVVVGNKHLGREFKRGLVEVNRIWRSPLTPGVEERVAIVVRTGADKEALLELGECVSLPCVELRELAVEVEAEDPRSIATELSSLMRELVRVNTVRNMKWSFKRCDLLCLSSVFSAIPSMAALESFTVTCDDLQHVSNILLSCYDMQSYYMWSTYALLASALAGRQLSVGLVFAKNSSELCERLKTSPSALIDPAVFRRLRDVTPVSHSSSAILRARSMLTAVETSATTHPFFAKADQRHYTEMSLVSLEDRHVDIIAYSSTRALVIWPGFGAVWVALTQLHDCKTDLTNSLKPLTSRFSLMSDLRCCNDNIVDIAHLLKRFGSGLKELSLNTVSSEILDGLTQILQSCRQLKTLHVSSMTEVEPLITMYKNGSCRVSTLTIGTVSNSGALHVLLKALNTPASRMGSHIKRLSILGPYMLDDDIEMVVSIMGSNRRLNYIRLCTLRTHNQLSEFVDQPLMQTSKSKRSVYTFLLATRRHGILRSLPMPCAEAIVKYAATPKLRQVLFASIEEWSRFRDLDFSRA